MIIQKIIPCVPPANLLPHCSQSLSHSLLPPGLYNIITARYSFLSTSIFEIKNCLRHVTGGVKWTFSQTFIREWRFDEEIFPNHNLLNRWMNELMTKVFIEQPGFTGSAKNTTFLRHWISQQVQIVAPIQTMQRKISEKGHLSPSTRHRTTTICIFSYYESSSRFGDAAAGGLVIDSEDFFVVVAKNPLKNYSYLANLWKNFFNKKSQAL